MARRYYDDQAELELSKCSAIKGSAALLIRLRRYHSDKITLADDLQALYLEEAVREQK